MQETATNAAEQQHLILSSLSPGPAQKWLASAVVFGMLAIFLLITVGPFGSIQLVRVQAFVPAYVSAMVVNNSITAVLLFSQFSILRSQAVLVIASAYLFNALVLVALLVTFPGVFGAEGLIGGLQSLSWFYFSWHAGFAMFVIAYALRIDANPDSRIRHGSGAGFVILSIGLTAAVFTAVATLCLVGEPWLPRVRLNTHSLGPLWPYIGVPVALLSVVALLVLWSRRRSVLDLWLMVVVCAHAVEVPLTYFPAQTIFSVGWYAGRINGLLSGSLLLIVLLYEITTLYAKLFGAMLAQRREREARLLTGDAVAAAIAHEVRQPLAAMIMSADAGLRFLDRSAPDLDGANHALRRVVADGHRAGAVVSSIRAVFKNDVRNRTLLDMNELVQQTLLLTQGDLLRRRIQVQSVPADHLPEVRGDRIQLQQVLLNLITNAADAMAVQEEPRILSVKSEAHDGDGVLVSIADSGKGIGSEDVDRVFSPLFTTKSDGMGMGLSICRSIIESHDGRLWVGPNNPRGSVFRFTLCPAKTATAGG